MTGEVQNKFNHAFTVLSVLKDMKDRQFTCDIAIKVEDESLRVHRAVLAACSDYFVQKLSRNPPEIKRGFIEVQDVSLNAMKRSVNFMYTGEAHVTIETVEETLHAAATLQLHGLTIICVRFLHDSLAIGNCLVVKTIALDFNLYTMAEVAQQYALENFDLVIETDGFKILPLSVIMAFIESTDQYERRWMSAIIWVKRDVEERSKYLFTMLQTVVSSGSCSFDFLYCSLWKECLVRDSDDCENLVVKTLLGKTDDSVINIDNCFDLLCISKKYEDQESKSVILKFMNLNFEMICERHAFKLLDEKDALAIFQSTEVKLTHIETKWKAATMWISDGFSTRKKHFRKILTHINLQEGGFDFLFNVVCVHPLLKQSGCRSCSSLVAKAIFEVMENTDITESNWYQLLMLARKWSTQTMGKILDFVASNIDDVRQHEQFVKLTETEITRVLESPSVQQSNDLSKWQALGKWVKGDPMERTKVLKELIRIIDLSGWRFSFLYDIMNNDSLVQQCTETKKLIVSTLVSFLKRSDINFDNCFHLLELSKACNKTNASAMVRDFMRRNFELVSKEGRFVELSVEELQSLLRELDEKPNFNEKSVWGAVMEWKKYNQDAELKDILRILHLKKYSFEFLYSSVLKEASFIGCGECKELIISAIFAVFDYQNITIQNWFMLLQLAKNHEHLCPPVTFKHLNSYMAANFILISRQNDFALLDKSEILKLLKSQTVWNYSPHGVKLAAVTTWIEKCEQQNHEFLELLESLNLHSFPFCVIFNCVLKEQLVKDSEVCTEIVVKALLEVVKESDITIENYDEVMSIARRCESMGSANAVRCVRNFMILQFELVYRQQTFLRMCEEDVLYIFRSDNSRISPSLKTKAALNWVKENEAERSKVLSRLFECIRLQHIPIISLKDLYGNDLIKKSQQCKDMITEAIFAQISK